MARGPYYRLCECRNGGDLQRRGGGHPVLQDDRLQTIGKLKQGVGLVCIHYAVEPTKERGEQEFLDWIGGAFEINWSVNPTWTADYQTLPQHPITRGVTPFKGFDEWYFYMRFRDGLAGVTDRNAVAPARTHELAGDGPHEGNPAVRASVQKGEVQHMAWAFQRPDGWFGGFGFTRRLSQKLGQRKCPEAGAKRDSLDGKNGCPSRWGLKPDYRGRPKEKPGSQREVAADPKMKPGGLRSADES